MSLLFAGVVSLRRRAYRLGLLRCSRADVPVVVVGNLVAGGSGKTPLVLWIVEFLRVRGFVPGIVSRGYGAASRDPREVAPHLDSDQVGDEPLLLARRAGAPVWIGVDRVAAARALRAAHPEVDVLVLDDGLQHYRLARDIEIAIVDSRGFGNGFLLPAGPLREPPSRLNEVDAVVAHDRPAVEGYRMRLEGKEFCRLDNPELRRPAEDFAHGRIHAIAGIGEPARFFRTLAALGLNVVPHAFPDHHRFTPEEIDFGDGLPVVMTEKDAVKCLRFARPWHWVLPVRVEIDPSFGDWLLRRLGRGPAAS